MSETIQHKPFSREPRARAPRARPRLAAKLPFSGLVVCVSVSLWLGSRAAGDWPLFRGNPLQTGVAPAPLPEPLAVLWKLQAKDAFEATAAIAGGTVYAGAYDGTLYALDLATGKPKWTYKAGPIKAAPSVK